MATSQDYLDFVLEQLPPLWSIRSRKMFGEYMSGSIGDFAELHITAGEAYHPATTARIAENELKAVKEYTFTAFARSNVIVRIGRPDG